MELQLTEELPPLSSIPLQNATSTSKSCCRGSYAVLWGCRHSVVHQLQLSRAMDETFIIGNSYSFSPSWHLLNSVPTEQGKADIECGTRGQVLERATRLD